MTPVWFIDAMQKKIKNIDWGKAARDVASFLNDRDKKTLSLWSVDFFMDKLNKLGNIIL
ncbi:MAG: hypothetical protein ACD_60C00025G0010 [uncultured bacterium]|nr:MAG: hypothetical protein ACD_60C00025G0010 [uncultured bacterium]